MSGGGDILREKILNDVLASFAREPDIPNYKEMTPAELEDLTDTEIQSCLDRGLQMKEYLKFQQRDLKAEIERLKEHSDMVNELNVKLKGSLENNEPTVDKAAEMEATYERMVDHQAAARDLFTETVRAKFPKPSERDVKHFNSTNNTKIIPNEVFALGKILMELQSQLESNAANPYMEIKPNWWPPHVDVLLDNGLAVLHPSNSNEMRAVDLGGGADSF